MLIYVSDFFHWDKKKYLVHCEQVVVIADVSVERTVFMKHFLHSTEISTAFHSAVKMFILRKICGCLQMNDWFPELVHLIKIDH